MICPDRRECELSLGGTPRHPLQLLDHPDRASVMHEVHARPMEIVPPVCRLRRLVFVVPPEIGLMARVFKAFTAVCAAMGAPEPRSGDRQHRFSTDMRHVTWEFHTEFVTVTWRSELSDGENWPNDLGLTALSEGQLIGALRIDVIRDTAIPERLIPGFNLPSLCLADIEGGKAQVATDLVPDKDKFVRFELAAGGLSELRRSIIVRRLLEIETYRTMALLGLPLARAVSPNLRAIEVELGHFVEGLSAAETPAAAQQALAALHGLSVRSGQLAERLSYRFAAGNAYGEILRMRLGGLRESATTRGSTLTHCIGSRVDPALATCSAMEKRLAVLSSKLERAVELLHAKIGVDVQMQNAAVLDTIARTALSQFLLQRTVEGLSTIAISYYLLGILSYALTGPLEELHWHKSMSLSLAAPLVLIAVWLVIRSVRRRHT